MADSSYPFHQRIRSINRIGWRGDEKPGGYTVGPNNQMTSDGTYTYEYDLEGNRTKRYIAGTPNTDVTEYEWDHRNRLSKVTHYATEGGPADQIVEYTYDFGNRWVRKVLDSNGDGSPEGSTVFVYDGNQIALQFDKTGSGDADTGDLSHRYLWGPAVDQILADEEVENLTTPGEVLWPLTDHLGSVRDLAEYDAQTDTTTIANHRTFDAFGNITSETAPAIDHLFAFTGRPFDDATGLQNNINRWYDPSVGRWLSEDPIGFAARDENLYRYVGNNPILRVDPSGLNPNQFGAKDRKELINIVKGIEGLLRRQLRREPTLGETIGAFLANMLEDKDPGGVNHYYVFSTKLVKWVDMRHFIRSAMFSGSQPVGSLPGRIIDGFAVDYAGKGVEYGQSVAKWWEEQRKEWPFVGAPGAHRGTAASAWGVEDLRSNMLGVRFGSQYLKGKMCTVKKLSSLLDAHLRSIGVGKKSESYYLRALPKNEQEWQKWRLDEQGRNIVEREGAMVRKSVAHEIDRELQRRALIIKEIERQIREYDARGLPMPPEKVRQFDDILREFTETRP